MKEYAEAQDSLLEGKPTALDWFIVEHEPEQDKGRDQFRKMLQDVIDEAILEYEKDNHSDPPRVEVIEPKNLVQWDVVLIIVMIAAICFLMALVSSKTQ